LFESVQARPVVLRGYAREINTQSTLREESKRILFGQTTATLDDDLLFVRRQRALAKTFQRAEHPAGLRSRDPRGTFHRLARFGATRKW
jgi:hypothetical protein